MIVFDVDGTILPGTSCERLFVRYLVKNRVLGFRAFVNFCSRAVNLIPMGRYFAVKANKGYLRGYSVERISKSGFDFFRDIVAPRISRAAIERINELLGRGERVILFSGMPGFLLANFAKHLGVAEYYGSVMEIKDGQFTGRTMGPFPLARGKVDAMEMMMDDSDVPWESVTFYADHWTDRYLLSRVGNPVVVNGGRKLLRLAKEKGWRSKVWD